MHGIPFATKDLADIAGYEPSFGSRCYVRGIAERTAPAIARVHAAGAILLGVTHMVEFAIGGWGTTYSMGTPRNPCDPDHHRVPGGSSSGSAVAVAAGLVPIDTGIVAEYQDLLAALRTGGHDLVPVPLALSPAKYQRRNGLIVAHEIHGRLADVARDNTRPIDPHVRQRVLAGAGIDDRTHADLLAQRREAIAQMRNRMADIPLILMPTNPLHVRRIKEVDEANIPLSRFTRIANYLDLAGVSLHFPGRRLPAGLQVMAGHRADRAALAAARARGRPCRMRRTCSGRAGVPILKATWRPAARQRWAGQAAAGRVAANAGG